MTTEPKAKILKDQMNEAFDSLQNLVANLGTNQDKRQHSKFKNTELLSHDGNREELAAMYRTDWISGKVVDIIPDDMCREWREFKGEIEPEQIEQFTDEENRLGIISGFKQAHKWGRLFGTGFIIMSIDDGQTPEQPVNFDAIKEGGLRHIKVIDRHQLNHAGQVPIIDPLDPNFGMPEFYRINQTSIKIHHSRVIRFDGITLPFDDFQRNNYFSDSVLARLYDDILNFKTTANGTASMVFESNVDIVKVKGLMSYLQTETGEANLRKRFTLAKVLKSFNNLLLLDQEEDFETKTNTFAGLPDLLDRFAKFLAAASDIPATRLLGTSAQGLNATGEGDMRNYYDMIKAKQVAVYKPLLDRLDPIIAKSAGLPDDLDLKYKFKPLYQMTPTEISTLQFQDAQRDQIYLQNDIVTNEIVVKELKQNDVYTNITDDYITEIENMEDLDNDFGTSTLENGFGVQPEVQTGTQEEVTSNQSAT